MCVCTCANILAKRHPSSQAAAAKACTSVAGKRPSAKHCNSRRAKADTIAEGDVARVKVALSGQMSVGFVDDGFDEKRGMAWGWVCYQGLL